MPLQEALESSGHTVTWRQDVDPRELAGEADVIVLGSEAGDLEALAHHYRGLDPVPALVAVGSSAQAREAAAAVQIPFVLTNASAQELGAAVRHALEHRYAAGLSLAFGRGALQIEALGTREDQMVQVVRHSRKANITLVQEALRWYPQHYVSATDVVAMLRDARALQIPEVELVKLCDGSRTLQTLVRAGSLAPAQAAALLWALACVGAIRFTPEPPDGEKTRRCAVLMARAHLLARRDRLDASTYYDVLEVSPNVEIGGIEHAVQLLARRYSPEALADVDLGSLSDLAAPIWQQILKARQTLSDWSTRGRYNDWLKANVDAIQTTWAGRRGDLERAEASYARGQEALVQGDAHAAVSHFAAAARTYSNHPDYECSLAWARFRSEVARGKERSEVAPALRKEAEAYNFGVRPWPRALVALALLCAADGDSASARWHVREALSIDPHLPAARALWSRLGGEG